MAVNIRPFGKLLNVYMYDDTCTITRLKQTKDQYGATKPNGREESIKIFLVSLVLVKRIIHRIVMKHICQF